VRDGEKRAYSSQFAKKKKQCRGDRAENGTEMKYSAGKTRSDFVGRTAKADQGRRGPARGEKPIDRKVKETMITQRKKNATLACGHEEIDVGRKVAFEFPSAVRCRIGG